ncbi:MAG TPA: MFS transporter [Bryobacteraceae bacterium]|nr:MFS transporter [Bryobacteraceae bacterium]HPT26328.1 MFS transporter [Bryobacteraceae bacterium]
MAGFCSFLDLYSTQPILPLLARELGAHQAEASLTVTVATAGVALSAPLAGALAGRFGAKRTIAASAWLLALFTAMAVLSRGLGDLLVWRFLQGVVTPGIFAVTVAYIQRQWAGRGPGAVTASYVTGTVVGGFTGRALSGWMAGHFGWRSSFLALAVLNAAGAAALSRFMRPDRRGQANPSSRTGLAMLFRNNVLMATCAVGFCVLFSMHAIFTYIPFHLASAPYTLGPGSLGSIFSVYLIGAFVTPWFGRRIDHYGHRAVLAVAMAISSAGALLTLSGPLTLVIAGLALTCTGVFVAQAAASSHIGVAVHGNLSMAVGLYVTCYYIGGSAGAAVPGWFWNLGGWPVCVALVVAVQGVTVGLAWRGWAARS